MQRRGINHQHRLTRNERSYDYADSYRGAMPAMSEQQPQNHYLPLAMIHERLWSYCTVGEASATFRPPEVLSSSPATCSRVPGYR